MHASPATEYLSFSGEDRLIDITDIRALTKLGRTSAYELTRRPEFPSPVPFSPRCYRWWASEVMAFLAALRQDPGKTRPRRPRQAASITARRRITGRVRAARSIKDAS